ncbi:MAG: ATP-binding protein, partial [Clostridia bacterium]
PFTTTRTTRKVGMGIPLFMQATKDAEGSFEITSKLGVGTTVVATFKLDSIDRAPLGDLVSTILTQLDDNVDFVWNYEINGKTFTFDTRELKMELDGISVCSPEVVAFVKDLLTENIETVNGGMML